MRQDSQLAEETHQLEAIKHSLSIHCISGAFQVLKDAKQRQEAPFVAFVDSHFQWEGRNLVFLHDFVWKILCDDSLITANQIVLAEVFDF